METRERCKCVSIGACMHMYMLRLSISMMMMMILLRMFGGWVGSTVMMMMMVMMMYLYIHIYIEMPIKQNRCVHIYTYIYTDVYRYIYIYIYIRLKAQVGLPRHPQFQISLSSRPLVCIPLFEHVSHLQLEAICSWKILFVAGEVWLIGVFRPCCCGRGLAFPNFPKTWQVPASSRT